jgi:hypothetical protein
MSTRLRPRRIVALAVMAAMMFALLPAAPAAAGDGNWAGQGTATLNSGTLACGTGTLTGTVSGTHANAPVANATVTATFAYCNNLADGTAEGNLVVSGVGAGTHKCGFDWVRTGATATITLKNHDDGTTCSGTCTAVLIPTSAPGAVPGTAEVTFVCQTSH